MKELKRIQRLLLVLCLGLLIAVGGRSMRSLAADATPTPSPAPTEKPVKVEAIDYENLWLIVNGEDNTAVYYSDKGKKTWSKAEQDNGKYYIDISWIKATASGEINVKGDKNEEIVTVTIPARESKYKVKFDKVNGTLVFSGLPSGVEKFQWRKTTSYQWNEASVADAKTKDSAFCKELEKFRVSGASIYVRIAGVDAKVTADGKLDIGSRPGKEVKVSITKRANAPKLKVNGSKLTVNTTTSMEYSINNGLEWKQAGKTMSLDLLAPEVLGGSGQDKAVWFRKRATANSPYSKTFVLEIPAQRPAPDGSDFSFETKDGKFCLTFSKASKATPYEYTVVKEGVPFNPAKTSWKSVVTAKTISISQRTAPAGSTIYIRKKAVNQTSTTNLELASDYAMVPVSY